MILAVYGAAMAIFGQTLPVTLRARAIAIQGLVGVGFLAFLIFTSNPFLRTVEIPPNGSGLNIRRQRALRSVQQPRMRRPPRNRHNRDREMADERRGQGLEVMG